MRFKLRYTYSLMWHFAILFVLLSFLLRVGLSFISAQDAGLTLSALPRIFITGLIFDLGVAAFFCFPYAFYLLFVPASKNGSLLNKTLTYIGFFIVLLVVILSFFAEVTFWNEFQSRFNFIAVDYLVYTYEVVANINQSYPLPLLLGVIALAVIAIFFLFHKRQYFAKTFNGQAHVSYRLLIFILIGGICAVYGLWINNGFAENGKNRFQDELSKAGIYSFFAAFKNNELNYNDFYRTIDTDLAFQIVKNSLTDSTVVFENRKRTISRNVASNHNANRPNVIMVVMESFSADFMTRFGNKKGLTPVLDSIADRSILFTNMYATGTRTVRGMEALSLSIPPTPGSSIVRRPGNENLTTIGSIFQENGYKTALFYGGDGYFDNMNHFFGNNGYSIVDRGRNMMMQDKISSKRQTILSKDVTFENAWGICDEDLYRAVLRDADARYASNERFYDFVMLTSNHRPYTYPGNSIDIPPGTGRDGAVKYTDYAVGKMLDQIKTKPWFDNTIIIFVADHCAGSAGKNEIDISKYHIPAMIYNLKTENAPFTIDKRCSQIDLYPTLFALLGWNYKSNLFGQDVLNPSYQPRAFFGTYQKLAYLKSDSLVILSPQRKVETFRYSWANKEQSAIPPSENIINEAIANYQAAYFLFKNGGLKIRNNKSQ